MHRRDRLAEPVGLTREVATHLVGVQVALGEQVAGARGRHVPALGGVRGEFGDHPERVRLAAERRLVRPEQPRDVWVARPRQHPVQLDVRVDARRDAAEHLEDGLFLEDDAGVALFGARNPRGGVGGQLDAGLLAEAHIADCCRRIDQRQKVFRVGRVVERVVSGPVTVHPDRRDIGVLLDGAGIPPHDHLIAVRGSVGVGGVEQHEVEVLAQRHRHRGLHRRTAHGCGLRTNAASAIHSSNGRLTAGLRALVGATGTSRTRDRAA